MFARHARRYGTRRLRVECGITRRVPPDRPLRVACLAAPARPAGLEHPPATATYDGSRPGGRRGRKPPAGPTRPDRTRPSVGRRHHPFAAAGRALVLLGSLAQHFLPARSGLAPGRSDTHRPRAHRPGTDPDAMPTYFGPDYPREPGQPVHQHRLPSPHRASRGQALGRRAPVCLAGLLPPTRHRLRLCPRQLRNLAAGCQFNQVPQSFMPLLIPQHVLRGSRIN